MTDDQFPKDTLFIQWGKFRAGASGRFAVAALLLAATVLWLAGHVLGAW